MESGCKVVELYPPHERLPQELQIVNQSTGPHLPHHHHQIKIIRAAHFIRTDAESESSFCGLDLSADGVKLRLMFS